MSKNDIPRNWIRAAFIVLGPTVAAACATGLDPVRLGEGGAGTGGTGAGLSTSSTGATGGASTGSSSSTSTTSSTTSSSSTGASSSTSASSSSSSTTSASSSSGTVMGLSVQYLCATVSPMSQEIRAHLQVVNNGAATVPLSSLKIRYYYTKDGSPATDQTFNCDYAMLGCGAISAAFSAATGTNADEYVELSFQASAGSLAAGASTGEIQARMHPTDYLYTFDQTNDYSFDPTKTTYATWSHITLYQNGTLVWGTEP